MWKLIALMSLLPVMAQAMPVDYVRPARVTALEAREVLEQRMGQSMDLESFRQLEQMIEREGRRDLVQVGNQASSKAVYCVGWNGSMITVMGQAACVHIWSLKGYTLAFIGAGMAFNISGQVFRLKVAFDPSRYDNQFDPVPGKYALVQMSGTLGLGVTSFSGDAGNKILSGGGVNLGLGIDLMSVSYLVIE